MEFVVGTFNGQDLYALRFEPSSSKTPNAALTIVRANPAIGGHSWLALSPNKKYLYCTAWTKPTPSIAAYKIRDGGRHINYINAKHVKNLSGYVCCSQTHVYSVGGATGEVYRIGPDGGLEDMVQELDFVDPQSENMSEQRGEVPHGDFAGLRHGAHSCDLSPDGKSLYVADIGRNCIWTYTVNAKYGPYQPRLQIGNWTSNEQPSGREVEHLELAHKHLAPRSHDGPRHTWPHPNGRILYSLQEHSSMVDVFTVAEDGVTLSHKQGVKIIPADKNCTNYWADEVRLSTGPNPLTPRYMYASTRGLTAETKGYVAVFKLDEDGTMADENAICIWETPTSGGIANAIEPAPWHTSHCGMEFLALTDSEEGWVFVLSFDGNEVKEVSRVNLGKTDDGDVVGAATAVWL
ncbi:muconate cycloisomerase 1 [Acrodontium crateriforme]|uniref:Muconate cycloisomerase 1 n=1 Tax=Acrodontium crateriforme TaxID=150365 RepID=A0AAQ3RB93_9PEZI|nr:muconate cycloisomerase 1 [Acrodontium crateriforme]